MNKFSVLATMIMATMCSVGNDHIRTAIDLAITENFSETNSDILIAAECGLPYSLYTSSSFSNLVSVVRSEVDGCTVSFVCSMTNYVPRKVFIEAVISCGQTAYRNAVVNWFGGPTVPAVQPEVIEAFVVPTRTSMEGYFIDHYNEPGVSNVWVNIKSRYMTIGADDEAAGIDDVLSGKSKAEREMLDSIESR